MDKRGQEDFVTFIMSVLLYAIFFLVILIILNIPGCRSDVRHTITSNSGQNVNLVAEEQLTAYLRTQMPENLPVVVEKFETSVLRKIFEKLEAGEEGTPNEFFYGTLASCIGDAKAFLMKHPELYVERDYAGFIDAMGSYFESEKDKRAINCAFDLATKAVFVKSYIDTVSAVSEQEIYYSPNIAVEYRYDGAPVQTEQIKDKLDLVMADFEFRNKGRMFSFGDEQRYMSMPASPVRIIPLNDGSLAAVQLIYFHENERFRLPAP